MKIACVSGHARCERRADGKVELSSAKLHGVFN